MKPSTQFRGALLATAFLIAMAAACGSQQETTGGSGGAGGGSSSSGMAGAATGGSSESGSGGGCTDSCDTVGAVGCDGNGVITCEELSSGCKGWSPAVACPGDDVCSGGQCAKTCSDQCTAGTTRCSGVDLQTCAKMASGCTDWSVPNACPGDKTCAQGVCTMPDPCVDMQCTTPPAPVCVSSTMLRTSSSPGTCTAGNCSYAYTDAPCASGCSAGACNAQQTAVQVSAGQQQTCAVTSAGALKCWGDNQYGELGDGSTTDSPIPVDVTGLSSGVVAVATGFMHTCAITSGGGVKCWGRNAEGQLGDNSMTERHAPVDVMGLSSGVVAIAAGDTHTCAVTSAGGVKCWGDNAYFKLGNSAVVSSPVPLDVAGLAGVVSISAGTGHTCVVTSTGDAKCWGMNNEGQLGNNSVATTPTPMDVTGLSSGVVGISCGDVNTCAVVAGGGVKCWGNNANGELGNGTTTSSAFPLNVTGLSAGVPVASVSTTVACAITSAGGVSCWGFGFLGTISENQSDVPVGVTGLSSGVTGLSSGDHHACALLSTGGIMCWGNNEGGNLGNNSTAGSFVPVAVVGF